MLATESDRLNYLSALGITQYRARAPLPFAAPSLVLQQTDLAALSSAAITSVSPISAEANDPPPAKPVVAPLTTDSLDTGLAATAAQPASSMQSGASAALNAISHLAPAKTAAESTNAAASTESDLNVHKTAHETTLELDRNSQAFHCQLALWQQDELFILVDVTQLQAADMQLLKNILTACGRKPQLAAPQQFSWPMAKRRNSAFIEAREHFLGLLDASLAQSPVKQLISFGAQSLRLLTADHETADQLSDTDCEDALLRASLRAINFAHRWPLTALPSLTQMQQQPARYKPLAWQLLQSRITL